MSERIIQLGLSDAEANNLAWEMMNQLAEAVERTATEFIRGHRNREGDRADLVLVISHHFAREVDAELLAERVAHEERLMGGQDPDARYQPI